MSVLRFRSRRLGLVIGTITLITVTLSSVRCASYRWKPVPVTNLSLEREKIAGRVIRLTDDSGVIEMEIRSLEFPYVSGQAMSGNALVDVDLNSATRIELLNGQTRIFPVGAIRRDPKLLESGRVRFRTPNGDVVLRDVTRVEDPWVTGHLADGDGPIRVDLGRVSAVEVRELSGSGTTLRTAGLTLGIVAAAVILVALTKESCPFVYVDRGNGWEFMGEAYAGAAFRSTQRDDLLPLPEIGDAETVRIRLRNEARETQYTDRAELVIVEHAPHLRALSTFDGDVVLVGDARAPDAARERRGRDAITYVANRDERLWVTNPDAVAATEEEAFEDQLTAEFSTPSHGTPVLELVAGNTAWLDLVFGRFFAAMGDRLPTYLARGNERDAGPRIQRWREREGVDLIVELRTGESWQRVAVVPTVGPAALRHIAVPLPIDRNHASGSMMVRIRGGLGFWRIDHLSLSAHDDSQPMIRRVQATRATAGARDQRAAIFATDGRYDALSAMNESLDMTFSLPAIGEGLSRSAFLFTNGYYNVHTPVQSQWRPGTLKVIRDEPGALSRFGRDLAREYLQRQQAVVKAGGARAAR